MAKENFGSKVGAILAAAGSAVGLGNIWRFPTETGEHGGAAFIIIYVAFMLLLGVPIMVSEFVVGRHSQRSVSESFYMMSGGRRIWRLMGLIPAVAGFLVLSYYAVVAGWTLYYTYATATGQLAGKTPEQFVSDFNAFSSDPVQPLVWMTILLIINGLIVALGINRGIERGAKIMMPLLFIFILILVGCSLSLPGAKDGLTFLFKPDFSKVDGHVVLNAMGQAFFSLSVGLCCLCTYACYFRKDVNLMKDAVSVGTIDTMVASRASSSSQPCSQCQASRPTKASRSCSSPCPTSSNRYLHRCPRWHTSSHSHSICFSSWQHSPRRYPCSR